MDKQKVAATEEDKEKWAGMIEMLTPIVKSYCTEMGLVVNDLAGPDIRRLWLLPRVSRRAIDEGQKINTIYEGTKRHPGSGSSGSKARHGKKVCIS